MRVETSNINNQYTMTSQAEVTIKEVKDTSKVHLQAKEVVDRTFDNDRNQVQEHEVIRAIEKANNHFKSYDRRLEFTIHDKTKQIMVKVIDTEDDSIIREIPSEKILDMLAKLWEMSGLFVDEKR